jgi:hypothetical protein
MDLVQGGAMTTLPFDALKAVQQFKKGTTPLDVVEYLNVGREVWRDGTVWFLDDFVSDGRSAVRFVKGQYGEGKTHLLYLTAKVALDRDFVVGYVTAERARLDKFDMVYRDLVSSLRTRTMVEEEGLDFAASTNGLKRIMERWFRERKIAAEGAVADRHFEGAKVNQLVKDEILQLDRDKRWDPNFRHAVQKYLLNLLAATSDAEEQNEAILNWLQGQPVPKAESKLFEVYAPIKSDNSRDMFRSLVQMLKAFGYRGMVALFDELELILEQSKIARNKAYDVVRQLLDNADSSGTSSAYILCAITPDVLTNEKGFKQYDALWERVRTDLTADPKLIDKRAVIMDLELTPFQAPELMSLAKKVREVHGVAMKWDAEQRVSDQALQGYVDHLLGYDLPVQRPRVLVRTVTQILEKAEQHPEYNPVADVAGEISESVTALTDQRNEAAWTWD